MNINATVQNDGRRAEDVSPRSDIVVGIDESLASETALRWAISQATSSGAPLRLVHAWQLSAAASEAVAAGAAAYLGAAAADARARATKWILETLGTGASDVHWTLEVREGGPGPVLTAAAADARLLVVGTREHTGLRRVVSGSVSHYLLSHARVPIVAVPAHRLAPPVPHTRRARDHDATVTSPLL